jgi:hypothetical protein
VKFYGTHFEEKRRRDFLVGFVIANHFENFVLPDREHGPELRFPAVLFKNFSRNRQNIKSAVR